jgi:hypothetical protein
VQAQPNEFYLRRIGSFIRGRTTMGNVELFFGRPQRRERQSNGFILYLTIEVYNAFEDRGKGNR